MTGRTGTGDVQTGADYPVLEHPWADSSAAPVYRITYPRRVDDEDLERYCATLWSWSRGVHAPIAYVLDLSRLDGVTPRQRRRFAAFMEQMHDFDERYCSGIAFVIRSPILRGVVTALFWLQSPPFEHRSFSNVAEATAWASSRVRRQLSQR